MTSLNVSSSANLKRQTQRSLRIIAVGGAGAMGRHASRIAARLPAVGRLEIADIDVSWAERLAAEIGPVATAVRLDATDPEALADAFAEADVVLNTMGPFARFGRPILTAAIEAGSHYLDIDDDWESTLEAFELDSLARERGVTAVIGLGASPGITNLLAIEASRRLDQVEHLFTGWKLSSTALEQDAGDMKRSGPSAAMEHWLLQCSGTVRGWERGALRDVTPLREVLLEYPDIGLQRLYSVGHPEPVTLPRTIEVANAMNLMSGPKWLFDAVRPVAEAFDRGELSLKDGAQQLERVERPSDPALTPRDPMPRLWALARGTRDGRSLSVSAHLTAWPPHRMGGMTGYPLAVGVDLLAAGLIPRAGVLAPEAAIDPRAFFDRLARLADPPATDADDLLVVREQPGGE
jgi:saccharopine dehydrogenase-like NADP-dependent oxidoreductase